MSEDQKLVEQTSGLLRRAGGPSHPVLRQALKMLESAAASGTSVLELGRGDQDFKRDFMNGTLPLVEGSVIASPGLQLARNLNALGRRTAKRCLALVRRAWPGPRKSAATVAAPN